MLGRFTGFRYKAALLAMFLGGNAMAASAVLTGRAINVTTGRAAGGDEVVLKSLAGGASAIGRGKTDSRGGFQFSIAQKDAPYLLSVTHQGVSYQGMAQSAAKPVEVRVYDAAAEIGGVTAIQDVERMQTDGARLQVIEEIAIVNASEPPRTLVRDRALELQLPPEAKVVGGRVLLSGWKPLAQTPAAGGKRGQYYFRFPLGPGETRFVVAYELPYRGEATVEPGVSYPPLEELVVMVPESMRFTAKASGVFQPVAGSPGTYWQDHAAVKPGGSLAFRISGTGQLPPGIGRYHSSPGAIGQSQQRAAAPAPPARLFDRGRWFLLAGFAVLLAAGVGVLAHRRKLRAAALVAVCLAAAASASAASVHGKAQNLTTGKPAGGDDVLLLTASQPTLELARGKTGDNGQFSFDLGGIQTAAMVCVIHQGIGHYAAVLPGNAAIDIQVYDVAKEVSGIGLAWDVQRFQTEGDSLSVQELILVRNASNPPRTLMNERPFEIQLPPDAVVDTAMVRSEGARPIGAKPVVSTRPGRYFFPYPLSPGETRFAVAYHLPYRGAATLHPEALYPVEKFGVVLPKSMKFEGKSKAAFRPVPETPGVYAEETGRLNPGEQIAFRVSGSGSLPKAGDQQQPGARQGVGAAPKGAPATAKRLVGLRWTRWLALAGTALVLAALGVVYLRKRRAPAVATLPDAA